MPPPPPFPGGAGARTYTAPAGGALPASPPLWDFQQKLIPTGESIAKSFGEKPTGLMKTLAWIVRATFLDPRVARQAALDERGTNDALLAIVLTLPPPASFSAGSERGRSGRECCARWSPPSF